MWDGKSDSIGDLKFEFQKKNVTSRYFDGEIVLNTKFTGPTDTFLNTTASFMFNVMQENGKMSVSEMTDRVLAEYNITDKERVTIDVVNTLYSLWKLAIIRWVSANPFVSEPVLCGGGEIVKITHDSVADVIEFMKSSEQYVGHYMGPMKKDEILVGIVRDITPIYAYKENGEIACIVSVSRAKQSHIVTIGHKRNYNELRLLIEHLITKEEEIKILLFGVLNNTESEKELATQLGFGFAGKLKKEIVSGDIDLYTY